MTGEGLQPQARKMVKAHQRDHDMVSRVDRHGEASVKCSGYARCRLGPKLMRSEKKGTTERGKILTRICKLEKEKCPTEMLRMESRGWKDNSHEERVQEVEG